MATRLRNWIARLRPSTDTKTVPDRMTVAARTKRLKNALGLGKAPKPPGT